MSEFTHISVCLNRQDGLMHYMFYRTGAKQPVELKDNIVRRIKIPKRFEKDLVGKYLPRNFIGDIIYEPTFHPTLMITSAVYPKSGVPGFNADDPKSRQAKGLGYFLEAMSTQHLKTQGVEYIQTTPYLMQSRRNQLEKVGLPIHTPVPIDSWIKGHLRGVRITARELRK